MIKTNEYVSEYSSLQRGQTVRVNHSDCPAGQDTKRRLYITRPQGSPGVVLFYCHNCSESGSKRDGIENYRDFDPMQSPVKGTPFVVPQGMVSDPDLWPVLAHSWRVAKGLTVGMCIDGCIEYDPSSHRIYLPMWSHTNSLGSPMANATLVGFQLRDIDGKGPKYYTALKDKGVRPSTFLGQHGTRTVVLVEDLASGLAVANATCKDTSVSVLVNYGIKVTPEILAGAKPVNEGIVWLDNDSGYVIDQAQIIARTWSLISGKPTHVVKRHVDPKLVQHDGIRQEINRQRVPF
jgi:hypothetical protein